MRSTRRSERFGPLVAVAVAIGAVTWAGFFAPPEPAGPRWGGAGHDRPRHGGSFVFHQETAVRSLDPSVAYDEVSQMGIRLVFDGLLDYDQDARLVPSLAEALPDQSEDGRTFRFHLRRGVRYHDGSEMVAEDVRFALERVLAPATSSPGNVYYQQIEGTEAFVAGEAAHVSGIRVLDRRTIEFRLKQPDQTFLNAMAMPFAYPLPRRYYSRTDIDTRTMPCGSGPFTLAPDDWERGVQLVFHRNRRYWNAPRPWPDTMVFLENLPRDVAVMRFRNGDIDAVHRFSPADSLSFQRDPEWAPYRVMYPKVSMWGIVMNTQMPPFDDAHMRRAVAYAMDRAGWSRARNNRLLPTGQPLPPQLAGYDPELPGAHHMDLAAARREMALAGHAVRREGETWVAEGLEGREFEYWVGQGDTGRQYAELAQADLAKIGLRLRIKQVSFPVLLEETGKPNRVPIHMNGWNMDFPDAANFLDVLFHTRSIARQNSSNRAFYSNPELDALLDRARIERDPVARTAMYRDAQILIVRDAPWAFMWNDLMLEAWQPYVREYVPSSVFSEDYRDVWLDLPKQRLARRFGAAGPRSALAALFPFGRR